MGKKRVSHKNSSLNVCVYVHESVCAMTIYRFVRDHVCVSIGMAFDFWTICKEPREQSEWWRVVRPHPLCKQIKRIYL